MSARIRRARQNDPVPLLPASVIQAPLDVLIEHGPLLDSCSVVSLIVQEPVPEGWRLLDQMRDAFVAIRDVTTSPVEIPIPIATEGALDVLALRPELARVCGAADEHAVATFVALCRQFDVVPVVPRAYASLLGRDRRGVLDSGPDSRWHDEGASAASAIRILPAAGDIVPGDPVTRSVEIVVAPHLVTHQANRWRSVVEHRTWLGCLETRECVG